MNDRTGKLRLGVLISGGGTTLQNIAECIARHELPAEIACVIASNVQAYGLVRAERLGLARHVVSRRDFATAEAFSEHVAEVLRGAKVHLVCMAGYLSLWRIPADFLPSPPTAPRVMNIHPALLPKFGGKGMHGLHVHAAVLAAGEKESGCTVHFADNQYDHGPIIVQRLCPVLAGDTPETLAQRVFAEECRAYPEAIRLYAEGRLKVVDGNVETTG